VALALDRRKKILIETGVRLKDAGKFDAGHLAQ